ncbi:MAG: hypothetical protein KME16_23590 [Scytolyngbya sp. HA4215-MV1]|jgi:hypothetical protein|nr:hypothetical protein [Scytolyngbya sp. HA4215-MV1]
MTLTTATVRLSEDNQTCLTSRQIRAVAALLRGLNYVDAATEAEVSLSSIKRWVVLPEFKAAIAAGKKQAIETAVFDLADGCSLSVTTLMKLMRSAESETVRCRAAEAVLNSTMRLFEMGMLVDRVSKLESLINEP